MKVAIRRFKYAGRKTLVQSFTTLLEQAWILYPEIQSVEALVPIPLHRSSHRERGFNQAALLAHALSPLLSVPVFDHVLVRTRRTVPQFRLRREQRLTNLKNAFQIVNGVDAKPLKSAQILLIDDVCTTGTTLVECAQTLKSAGASAVKALVLARDV